MSVDARNFILLKIPNTCISCISYPWQITKYQLLFCFASLLSANKSVQRKNIWRGHNLFVFVTTQHNHNTTQPQHCSWVVHENDCANPPPPPPPPHHTNSTWASGASELHSLMTTKYSVISNNKQGHNNNNINNKIISFRSLRLTFIDHKKIWYNQ